MSPHDDIDRRSALQLFGSIGALGTIGTGLSLSGMGAATNSAEESQRSPTVAWEHTYSKGPIAPTNDLDGLDAVTTTDSGYCFAGTAKDLYRDPGNQHRMYLLWTDEAGEPQHEQLYGDDQSVLHGMAAGDDGTLLVGSRTPQDDEAETKAMAILVDGDREVRWRHESPEDSTFGAAFTDATWTGDGYVVAGQTTNGGLLAVGLTPAGDTEWVTTLNSNSLDEAAVAVVPGVNDGYVILESYGVSLALVKLNDDGDPVWQYDRKVADQITGGDMVVADAGYTFVGSGPRDGERVDVVVGSVAPDGSERWTESYDPEADAEYGHGIVATPSGYAVAGRTGTSDRDGEDSDGLLLTLAPEGTRSVATTLGGSEQAQSTAGIATTDDGYVLAGRAGAGDDPSAYLCKVTLESAPGDGDDGATETPTPADDPDSGSGPETATPDQPAESSTPTEAPTDEEDEDEDDCTID
jgi:hypothetical protein